MFVLLLKLVFVFELMLFGKKVTEFVGFENVLFEFELRKLLILLVGKKLFVVVVLLGIFDELEVLNVLFPVFALKKLLVLPNEPEKVLALLLILSVVGVDACPKLLKKLLLDGLFMFVFGCRYFENSLF